MEWESGTDNEESVPFQSKESEVSKLIADGWTWISHGNCVCDWIVLDKAAGDDIGLWLAVVEDHHLLVRTTSVGRKHLRRWWC